MSGHHVAHHVAPKSLYYLIFGILMVGTIITVVVAYFDLGFLNNVVMLAIACTKAALVVLYFMHVRWSTRLTWIIAASGFVWLLIMFGFTLGDYLTRPWDEGIGRNSRPSQQGIAPPKGNAPAHR